MDPKDFKFNDDAFDDVFSSSGKNEFEDIYSSDTQDVSDDDDFAKNFDDIFNAKSRNKFKIDFNADEDVAKTEGEYEDEYDKFADEYFEHDSEVMSPKYNPSPKNNPYTYNYDKAAQKKASRVSKEHFDDDISDDISSGDNSTAVYYEDSLGKKIIKKFLLILLVLLVLIVAGGIILAKSMTEKVNYVPLESNQYTASSDLAKKEGVKNILLVGVDARKGESNSSTRSDTMMLLTIDKNNRQIKLTSFLRDTYIEIPGYKWAKLNAAQSHGGTQLLVDTIEYNFGIDIDNYMLVNFDMFKTIIDSLGGIDIEVTEKEAKYINSQDHMTAAEREAFPEAIESGINHFNGAQALWYSRIRYLDNDFMRTQRQRKVISCIISKAKFTNPAKLIQMLGDIMPMLETDLTSEEMMLLGVSSPKYIFYDVLQQSVPVDGTWNSGTRNGQSVLLIDLYSNKDIINDFIFNKAEKKEE